MSYSGISIWNSPLAGWLLLFIYHPRDPDKPSRWLRLFTALLLALVGAACGSLQPAETRLSKTRSLGLPGSTSTDTTPNSSHFCQILYERGEKIRSDDRKLPTPKCTIPKIVSPLNILGKSKRRNKSRGWQKNETPRGEFFLSADDCKKQH